MSLYMIEKKFGELAVRMDYITDEQLIEAMNIQLREDLKGQPHRLLGQILRDIGHMNADQVNQVLVKMHFPTVFCLRHLKVAHHLDFQPDLA